jgi:hypothetical protein
MKENLILKLIEMLVNSESETIAPAIENKQKKPLIGEWVIVRCRDAGVHFGKLESYEGREVVLTESRRMWYWKAASGHTLSGCAVNGITSESKIAAAVTTIVLPEACEIIQCEQPAVESIGGANEYQPS